jgi:hypothetical protein
MALAIRFDQMIRDGVVKDQAELARIGFVTRARVTQIMNLLNLAPAIQQTLLGLECGDGGRDLVTERQIRRIADLPNWQDQRAERIGPSRRPMVSERTRRMARKPLPDRCRQGQASGRISY